MKGMVEIQISNQHLEHAISILRRVPSQSPRVIARAVNRAMDGLRTDAVRETHKKYFVNAKDVRSSLSFKKASAGNLMGAVVSRGKRHQLRDYKISPTRPRKGKQLIYGAVKREGGLKPLQHKSDDKPTGFLVKRAGGKYFPFYRIGYDKEHRQHGKIRSYISPSMPQIVNNEETRRVMEQGAAERLEIRLNHEIMRLLGFVP